MRSSGVGAAGRSGGEGGERCAERRAERCAREGASRQVRQFLKAVCLLECATISHLASPTSAPEWVTAKLGAIVFADLRVGAIVAMPIGLEKRLSVAAPVVASAPAAVPHAAKRAAVAVAVAVGVATMDSSAPAPAPAPSPSPTLDGDRIAQGFAMQTGSEDRHVVYHAPRRGATNGKRIELCFSRATFREGRGCLGRWSRGLIACVGRGEVRHVVCLGCLSAVVSGCETENPRPPSPKRHPASTVLGAPRRHQ